MVGITIKTIGYTLSFEYEIGSSIYELKNDILIKKNIPIFEQILFFNGKILEDSKTLGYYNINNVSIIYLFLNSDIINIFRIPSILGIPNDGETILGDINIIKNNIDDIKNKNNTFTLPNIETILADINIIKNDIDDIKNKNNTFTLPNIVILASIGVIGVTLFGISTAIFLELKKEKRKAA